MSPTAANCTVGNTTYAHGQTFKLDCKTQCVCENGRHACSSLCPKEQLPAPEDTISCRSPRLVEVPGHCCKMWLCENPTADVYATCHNASTSPWTPCSQPCGLGISTRFTSTNAGCHQLSSLRLCENRKCDQNNDNNHHNEHNSNLLLPKQQQKQQQQLISSNVDATAHNFVANTPKDLKDISYETFLKYAEHRIRKGHECRSLQRLGPARIRLGACVSRKLYRPKLCGRCHQHANKCCLPSVSTTIQVELLCPLNAVDPISLAAPQTQQQEQQQQRQTPQSTQLSQLWDTVSLEPIDQEFLQSHQIQIENKFIAVEWILKCECGKHENCNSNRQQQMHSATTMRNKNNSNYNKSTTSGSNSNNVNNSVSSNFGQFGHNGDNLPNNKNNENNSSNNKNNDNNKSYMSNSDSNRNNIADVNIISGTGTGNSNNNTSNKRQNNANTNTNEHSMKLVDEGRDTDTDNESDYRFEQHLVASSELQPDIIPYPALPPPRNNRYRNGNQNNNKNQNNNSHSSSIDSDTHKSNNNDSRKTKGNDVAGKNWQIGNIANIGNTGNMRANMHNNNNNSYDNDDNNHIIYSNNNNAKATNMNEGGTDNSELDTSAEQKEQQMQREREQVELEHLHALQLEEAFQQQQQQAIKQIAAAPEDTQTQTLQDMQLKPTATPTPPQPEQQTQQPLQQQHHHHQQQQQHHHHHHHQLHHLKPYQLQELRERLRAQLKQHHHHHHHHQQQHQHERQQRRT